MTFSWSATNGVLLAAAKQLFHVEFAEGSDRSKLVLLKSKPLSTELPKLQFMWMYRQNLPVKPAKESGNYDVRIAKTVSWTVGREPKNGKSKLGPKKESRFQAMSSIVNIPHSNRNVQDRDFLGS